MNERFECSPSLKHKLKHTLLCGCFNHHHSADYDHLPVDSPHDHPRLSRTSSAGGGGSGGMRSSRSEEFLNLKHKCRSLMTRMGTSTTPRGQHHRRSQSTDFRYDPHSYSLNFDEDDSLVDDYPYRNFSARLPPSPPPEPPSRSISDGALNKNASPSSSSSLSSSHHQEDTQTPKPAATALSTPPPVRVITAYS